MADEKKISAAPAKAVTAVKKYCRFCKKHTVHRETK